MNLIFFNACSKVLQKKVLPVFSLLSLMVRENILFIVTLEFEIVDLNVHLKPLEVVVNEGCISVLFDYTSRYAKKY